MTRALVPAALGALLAVSPAVARAQAPIIDMHLHAHSLSMYGGGASVCAGDQAISFPGVETSSTTMPPASCA